MSDYMSVESVTHFLKKKINLVVLHVQEGKTFICIKDIEKVLEEDKNAVIIIFTMNTVSAQSQFYKRIYSITKNVVLFNSKNMEKELKNCSGINPKEVKHVKNTDEICDMLRENSLRVLMMCSHKVRINNIKTLVQSNKDLSNKSVYIYMDEAHEYVPRWRNELNIMLEQECVRKLSLYTATPKHKITKENDPYWDEIYVVDVEKEYNIVRNPYYYRFDNTEHKIEIPGKDVLDNTDIPSDIPERVIETCGDANMKKTWYESKFPFRIGNELRLLKFLKYIIPRVNISVNEWSYNFCPGYIRKATHYMIKDIILSSVKNATVLVFNGDSKMSLYRKDRIAPCIHLTTELEPSNQIESVLKKYKLMNYPCFITGYKLISMSVTLINSSLGNFDNAFYDHAHLNEDDSYQLNRLSFNYSNWDDVQKSKIKTTKVWAYGEEYIKNV